MIKYTIEVGHWFKDDCWTLVGEFESGWQFHKGDFIEDPMGEGEFQITSVYVSLAGSIHIYADHSYPKGYEGQEFFDLCKPLFHTIKPG